MTERAVVMTPLLSRSDQAELEDYVPADLLSFRAPALPPGDLGDAATAVAEILLTTATIPAICAWLATRGHDVKMRFMLKVPGITSEISMEVSGRTRPEELAEDLRRRGVEVPES